MDSITQIALGAAVGEATLGRKIGRPAIWWGGICGLLPDLDVLVPLGDAVRNFTYHRSASHSLLVLTVLTPLMVWIILKRHPQWTRYRRRWYALVFLAFTTHVLLDGLTVYGTQMLWPLGAPPVMWSTIFIVDPAYSLPLIFGVAAAFFLSRKTGHTVNTLCLLLSCAYLVWTVGVKVHVGNVARESLGQNNIGTSRILTVPSPFNTFLWRILVMDDTRYYEGYYSIFDRERSVDYTAHQNNKMLLDGIEDHRPVRRLQWFTQGFYSVRRNSDRIIMTDLRMGAEAGYIFRFQVGRIRDGRISPVESRRIRGNMELSKLAWVWHRIWSKPAAGILLDG